MKTIKHIITLPLLFVLGIVNAQNDVDLLRYSMVNPIGTARYNAMGGAFGALGANFSALSSNPAGIGFYTRNETSFTLGTVTQASESDYYGEQNRLEKTRVIVPQGGMIFCLKGKTATDEKNPWNFHFGVGVNRLKDFNSNVYVNGINNQSSYMQDVAANSLGYDFGEKDVTATTIGNLAYQTGLIDDLNNTFEYSTFLGKGLSQKHILQERGNLTEVVCSYGGNWSEKVYFGLTLGIPSIRYKQRSIIGEKAQEEIRLEDPNRDISFSSYEIENNTDISGSGLNLKMGLIVKPTDFFRVGLAFHTPTWFNVKEETRTELSAGMRYVWMQSNDTSILPTNATYNYTDRYDMISPMKGILSMAFLVKNFGAISLEGELINYGRMRMEVEDDFEYNKYIENVVRANYGLSGVVRFGTEWKVDIFSFRAGYVWQSCPYKNMDLRNYWSNHTVTAGLGAAFSKGFSLDLAFMADVSKRKDDFYYLMNERGEALVKPALLDKFKYIGTLTMTWKF